jgi:hypothetical protein
LLSFDELKLEVFQRFVIQLELALERPIGKATFAPEYVARLLDDLNKIHTHPLVAADYNPGEKQELGSENKSMTPNGKGLLRKYADMKKDKPTNFTDACVIVSQCSNVHGLLPSNAPPVAMSSASPAFMAKGCLPLP